MQLVSTSTLTCNVTISYIDHTFDCFQFFFFGFLQCSTQLKTRHSSFLFKHPTGMVSSAEVPASHVVSVLVRPSLRSVDPSMPCSTKVKLELNLQDIARASSQDKTVKWSPRSEQPSVPRESSRPCQGQRRTETRTTRLDSFLIVSLIRSIPS